MYNQKLRQKFGLICFVIILLNASEDDIFTFSQNSNIALTFCVSILTQGKVETTQH